MTDQTNDQRTDGRKNRQRKTRNKTGVKNPAASDALKQKWQDPEYREKMSRLMKERQSRPGKRTRIGVPDGMTRAEAEVLWAHARQDADATLNVLADEIRADLLAEAEEEQTALKPSSPTKCRLCRAGFLYRGPDGDNSGRFCSDRCRDAYDRVGLRYRPPEARYTHGDGRAMARVTGGFRIACRYCQVEFNSNGLAFCSDECRRLEETRKEAKAAGHSPRRGRKCIDCGSRIARYTPTGKAAKATVVRCTACQRKATRVAKAA
jgi:hypothetical protein